MASPTQSPQHLKESPASDAPPPPSHITQSLSSFSSSSSSTTLDSSQSAAASVQQPFPGHPMRSNSFGLPAPSVNLPPNAAIFSFNGNLQFHQKDHPLKYDAPTSVGQGSSETLPRHHLLGPMVSVSSSPNLLPATSERPANPSFLMHSGLPGMPIPPIATVHRPGMPAPNVNLQQQMYPPPYHLHPLGAWFPPQQMSVLPGRPPFPYPTGFPGPLPVPGHAVPHPSGSFPDSRPPGANLVGSAGPDLAS